MKKLFTILVAVLLTATLWAQAPQKMNYQAVIRNGMDALVTNTQVGMKISILQGSATGPVVYTETQTPTTDANGLVSIEIGVGAGFSTIDWTNGIYFIKAETDPKGGTNYTITNTRQLMSVPGENSKTIENVKGVIPETDSVHTSSQEPNSMKGDSINLGNLSGVKTGDPDLNNFATKIVLLDSAARTGNEITTSSDVSETKVTAGTNVSVTGTGTTGNPYVINSARSILAFAEFYAMMTGDSTALVAPGASVDFSQNGPLSGTIARLSSNRFQLSDKGTYMVSWQVNIIGGGQLVLALDGVELPYSVGGHANGTTQVMGNCLITTTTSNSVLSVINPAGSLKTLTVAPLAGIYPVSASLVVTRIQ